MTEKESVAGYIRDLKEGRDEAEEAIFVRYLGELTEIAITNAKRMFGERAALLDPEIAAQSALGSVFRRIKTGKAERLLDRNQLFGFLVHRLRDKIIDQWRKETAAKRGEGLVITDFQALSQAESPEPNPEDVLRLQELFLHATAALPNDETRRIALLELDGHTDVEIGRLTGRSLRAVQLKLRLIRSIWQEELERDAYGPPV